jgi:hypothetical protein
MIGEKFGAYEIKNEIGRGGMGIVYKAVQVSLGRDVAIKVLPPQLSLEKEFVSRFFREARSAANLRHPNIVTIHDVGEENDIYYFAMEYLEGGSLEERIQRGGALPLEEAESIIIQMAGALDYAHKKGIIHRDIKPGNIIIDEEGRAVITDFGIAKAVYDQKLTRTGMTVGSPEYMSPEQVKGHVIDGRADFYSLGVVLYQMLSGHVPYSGDSAVSIAYQHVNEPIPSIRDTRPDLPAYVDGIVKKLLAKNPDERFQSGAEVVRTLEAREDPLTPERFPSGRLAEEDYRQPDETYETPAGEPFQEEEAYRAPVEAGYVPSSDAEQAYAAPPVSREGRKKIILALGAILCVLAVAIIAILLLTPEKLPYGPAGGGGSGVGGTQPQPKPPLDRGGTQTQPKPPIDSGGTQPQPKPPIDGGGTQPQPKLLSLDRGDPKSVSMTFLTALQKTDLTAMKELVTEDFRTQLEEGQSEDTEAFLHQMRQYGDLLKGVSGIGNLRRNPDEHAVDAVYAYVKTANEGLCFCFRLEQRMGGFEVGEMFFIPSEEFRKWPLYNPATDRHDFAAAAGTAGRALAALHAGDIDSLWPLMTDNARKEMDIDTPEEKTRIENELRSMSRMGLLDQNITDIRKDESGRLLVRLGKSEEEDEILLIILLRTGGVYMIDSFDTMRTEEYQGLLLVRESP